MSESQKAAYDAAYKVAYEAALDAAKAASTAYPSTAGQALGTGDEETLELSFQKITNALKNHWILIAALTLICAVLGFLYSQFLVTPQYEASVNMIVQSNTTALSDDAVSNEYVNSAKNLAKTYSSILNSSKVQNDVIKDLGLKWTSMELGEHAVAAPLTDSQIVKVTVTTDSADLSKSIADAYLRLGPNDLNELVEAGKCNAVSGVEQKAEAIKPGMKRTVALMALVGFALSFAYALFKELRKNFVVTMDDVKELLDLPVIGVIPTEAVN